MAVGVNMTSSGVPMTASGCKQGDTTNAGCCCCTPDCSASSYTVNYSALTPNPGTGGPCGLAIDSTSPICTGIVVFESTCAWQLYDTGSPSYRANGWPLPGEGGMAIFNGLYVPGIGPCGWSLQVSRFGTDIWTGHLLNSATPAGTYNRVSGCATNATLTVS